MTKISKLLETYRTIAEIPAEVAAALGFRKVQLKGGSYRLFKMDSPSELPAPYPLHAETPQEKAIVAHVRSASCIPLPEVPTFGKDLSACSWDGPLFRYHPVFAENPDFWRGKRILDVGCRYDHLAYSLTELLGDEFTYTGVELESIRYASAEHTRGKPHITFHERTDIDDICTTLPPQSVDILCTFNFRAPVGMYGRVLPLLSEQAYLFEDHHLITAQNKHPPRARSRYLTFGFQIREEIWVQRPISAGKSVDLDTCVGISIYSKK